MRVKVVIPASILGSMLLSGCLRCPNDISVSIGEFASRDAGLRAAIKRLPPEIRKCPRARGYRIIWIAPDPDDGRVDRQALLYSTGPRTLGYEHDVYSGISGRRYVVDEAAIRAVAEKGGTLEDFTEYDERVR